MDRFATQMSFMDLSRISIRLGEIGTAGGNHEERARTCLAQTAEGENSKSECPDDTYSKSHPQLVFIDTRWRMNCHWSVSRLVACPLMAYTDFPIHIPIMG
jgi:hypothetical protein